MNISSIHNCYGCGVCATICTQKIIEIKLNADGFYEPHIINENKCTDCGLCMDVCAFNHDKLSVTNIPIKSYAAWSNEPAIRHICSSGGIGFEIGRTLILKGYKVCGVKYNIEKNRAEHYIASTYIELIPSIGSKYIQSYTVDAFKAISRTEKYLVTGTPCQIDSFRRYLQKFKKEENFILMDFFCHGVPSMFVWNKYVRWAESKVGKLTYVSWRNKFTGWHDSWAMSIDGIKTAEPVNWHNSYETLIKGKKGFLNSRLSQGDMFYRLFLSDACLGKACYEKCKYKDKNSAADIRIGDLWGTTYAKEEKGVSGVVVFTEQGKKVLDQCNAQIIEHTFEVVAERQMKKCPKRNILYPWVMKQLKKENGVNISIIAKAIQITKQFKRIVRLYYKIFNRLKNTNNEIKSI